MHTLSDEQIDSLEGAALDAAVAKFVMGFPIPKPRTYAEAERLNHDTCTNFQTFAMGWVADVDWKNVAQHKMEEQYVEWRAEHEYHEDISASWSVVEEMRDRGFMANIKLWPGGLSSVSFNIKHESIGTMNQMSIQTQICRAALRATRTASCG